MFAPPPAKASGVREPKVVDDGNEDSPRRSGKKGSGGILSGLFSNTTLVLVIRVFVLGALTGAYLQHEYVEKIANSKLVGDYNSLAEDNIELDKAVDYYYKCLVDSGINPKTCRK